jgi:hypothetical protein
LGVGLTTPPQIKNNVTKNKEAKTGLICQGRHCKGLKDLRVGSWNVNMRILEVKNWKVTLNRDEWAQLLKKARAHQGLSRNDDNEAPKS